jgi:hypothetical protein
MLRKIAVTGFAAAALLHGEVGWTAEAVRCTCQFEPTSGYSAYGTRSVCSAYTRNLKGRGQVCEVAFGATGYQGALISRVGLNEDQYRQLSFDLTTENLNAIRDRAPEKISNAAFLRVAIPAYMRAAYLRADTGLDDDTLVQLDKQIIGASSELSNRIAGVFLGQQPPFETSWQDRHRVIVVRGAVRFIFDDRIQVVAVFFDPAELR